MNAIRIFTAVFALTCVPSLAFSAQLLVLNKSDGTLSFVEPETGNISATVPTGAGPHEIEVSKDGTLAFVSNYGSQTAGNTLSVIDVAARKELRRVDLGEFKRPHGLAVVGDHVYITVEANRSLARYDAKKNQIDWHFETAQDGTHMVLASRDGAKLFTTNIGSGTVSALDKNANGQWQQTLIPVGNGPEGMDLAPNGRELWVAQSRDGGVSIIDVTNNKSVKRLDAKTQRSNRLKFTPDGSLVLISDLSGGELVVLDAKSHAEKSRIKIGRTPTGILIPPEGKVGYVACSGDNVIAVLDLKTLQVAKTIKTGGSPDGMAWIK